MVVRTNTLHLNSMYPTCTRLKTPKIVAYFLLTWSAMLNNLETRNFITPRKLYCVLKTSLKGPMHPSLLECSSLLALPNATISSCPRFGHRTFLILRNSQGEECVDLCFSFPRHYTAMPMCSSNFG